MFRPRSALVARVAFAMVGTIGLLTAGCGKPEMREGFAEAYGTVTLDEKPLPNAQVALETDKGTSYGRTDQDGRYVAEYSRGLVGAGKGKAAVRISTSVVFPDEDTASLKLEYDPRIDDYRKPELVPAKYNTRSELVVDITDDGAPYDFRLTTQ